VFNTASYNLQAFIISLECLGKGGTTSLSTSRAEQINGTAEKCGNYQGSTPSGA
jgi:hypothetical protein